MSDHSEENARNLDKGLFGKNAFDDDHINDKDVTFIDEVLHHE
jgi:hypothetical protein